MNTDWKQVYETKLLKTPDDYSHINVRVSATPDSVSVITDITKYVGRKATRLGVGLFPDELQWVLEKARTNSNCEKQFDFKKVKLEFEADTIAITVIKTDWSEQKIFLDQYQICRLLELEAELKCAVNDAFKFVKEKQYNRIKINAGISCNMRVKSSPSLPAAPSGNANWDLCEENV